MYGLNAPKGTRSGSGNIDSGIRIEHMTREFEITVRYDSELRERLEAGPTDPLGWIDTVAVDDRSLIGGDSAEGMKEYLVSLFCGLLQSVPAILDGERAVVETGNGPVYLAIDPVEGDTVRVAVCYSEETARSSAEREPYEPSAVVDVQSFVEEIIRTASEFKAFVSDVDPDLANESAYRGLREDVERAENAYETGRK